MNADERIAARWCVDSETGERVLINCVTNEIISRGAIMSEASETFEKAYRDGYERGRSEAFKVTDDEIVGFKEDLEIVKEELSVLKSRIFAYVQLGQQAFGGGPSFNE